MPTDRPLSGLEPPHPPRVLLASVGSRTWPSGRPFSPPRRCSPHWSGSAAPQASRPGLARSSSFVCLVAIMVSLVLAMTPQRDTLGLRRRSAVGALRRSPAIATAKAIASTSRTGGLEGGRVFLRGGGRRDDRTMEGRRAPRNGSRSAFGIMATGRRTRTAEPTRRRTWPPRGALWSRCEAALAESRITVAASDRDGRYTWIFNPPGRACHRHRRQSRTARCCRPTPPSCSPRRRQRRSPAASRARSSWS